MNDEPSEHARYRHYLDRLDQVSQDSEPELVRTVLADPDKTMAVAAVIHHINSRARTLDNHQFAAWSTRMATLVEGHDLPLQRLSDWTQLKASNAGKPFDPAALTNATDWLQRATAETTTAPAALALLAAQGRTRRVRNTASLRARTTAADLSPSSSRTPATESNSKH
jgi:hypothetical protein